MTDFKTTRPLPIAIIGMGCLFPKAPDLADYWSNIISGVDAVGPIPPSHWRPEDYYTADPKAPDRTYARRGGFLDPVDFVPLDFGLAPNALEATDTTQLLGLLVARQALADAGYDSQSGRLVDRSRISVILGVTGTLELVIPLGARLGHPTWRRAMKDAGIPEKQIEDAVERISASYVNWQEDSFPGLLGNVTAGRIANRLDLGGTNCVVDAACASSLSAVHLAMLELELGRSDMVLTGGMDTFNDIFMYMCFSKTPALSPTGDARPFDRRGDGTILGEGLGCLVLKRLADAERDGDRIYAVIRSLGTSSDGKGQAIYAPSSKGQVKALDRAYKQAGVSPGTIELIEAHGTGTRAGDLAEVKALTEVFSWSEKEGSWCAVGSVKSQIGHTKAAAGAAGLIKAALALYHKVLPPTLKVEEPLEGLEGECGPLYVNKNKRPWLSKKDHPRRAGVSAFGFGGSNFHCLLEEYKQAPSHIAWDGQITILAFSSDALATLRQQIKDWEPAATWQAFRASAAKFRRSFSPAHAHRLVMVIEKKDFNPTTIKESLAGCIENPGADLKWNNQGVYYGTGAKPGKLAFLFPGQGSQYVGMLRDLVCAFPQALKGLEFATETWESLAPDRSLPSPIAAIYPTAVFSDIDRRRNDSRLQDTRVTQPALAGVIHAALETLRHFGLTPEASAGHSFGELAALYAAGRLDAVAFHRLAILRGQLMAQEAGDRGGMLAVSASEETVGKLLKKWGLGLTLANKNCPTQVVLSGSVAEIAKALDVLNQEGLAAKKLPVGAAFHSPLVAGVRDRFLKALEEIRLNPAAIPVYSNMTGMLYPEEGNASRIVFADQLCRPVEFQRMVETLYHDGFRTFLEVGPGGVLKGLVGSNLAERDHVALSLDASRGSRSGLADLASCLAPLAALGYPVNLLLWDEDAGAIALPDPNRSAWSIPICGANYVKPRSDSVNTRKSNAHNPIKNTPDTTPGRSNSYAAQDTQSVLKVMAEQPQSQIDYKIPGQNPPKHEPGARIEPIKESTGVKAGPDALAAILKLSEQTAQLHKQFLDGQEQALEIFAQLAGMPSTPLRETPLAAVTPTLGDKTAYLPPSVDTRVGFQSAHTNGVDNRTDLRPASFKNLAQNHEPESSANSKLDEANRITRLLLEVVSEKTGYPTEMLDPAMELDADLGIDSIKRVEILSVIQERLPEAPIVKAEHLGTLHTLRQVAEFLEKTPSADNQDSRKPLPEQPPTAFPTPQTPSSVEEVLLAAVSEKTGYPVEMLDLNMEMDADLGIDSIKRVEILSVIQERLPGAPVVKAEHLGSLSTLRQVAQFLDGPGAFPNPMPAFIHGHAKTVHATAIRGEESSGSTAQALLNCSALRVAPLLADNKRKRLELAKGSEIWVTHSGDGLSEALSRQLASRGIQARILSSIEAIDGPPSENLAGLIIIAPKNGADSQFLKQAFGLLKDAGGALTKNATSRKAQLITVSRMDGSFGVAGWNALANAYSGGLAGLVKTTQHEWPKVHAKAIDLSPDYADLEHAAWEILDEMQYDGPLEVGLAPSGRALVGLQSLSRQRPPVAIPKILPGGVVVISGGGRGVTAEAAIAIAERFKPTLILLGRTPLPDNEPHWLLPLTEDAEIKRALAKQLNGAASPREVANQFDRIKAGREINATLDRIRQLGISMHYRQVDITHGPTVAQALAAIQKELGPVRGLIHGAGVLADRLILDKSAEQFSRVYDTKVAGLDNLLCEIDPDSLRLLILFSSITARLGRRGQVDYAVANEVLNKKAREWAHQHPQCHVQAINWGPWAGGMVDAGLEKVFVSEGIGLIPLKAGAAYLVEAIRQGAPSPVEIIVAAPMAAPMAATVIEAPAPQGEGGELGLAAVMERQVSVDLCPILADHVLDQKAVLPTALILEWMAHAALHAYPGWQFQGADELRILKGVRLNADQAVTLTFRAGQASRSDGGLRIRVEMVDETNRGKRVLFANADIVLGLRMPAAQNIVGIGKQEAYPDTVAGAYRHNLFHGEGFRGIKEITGIGSDSIAGWVESAPAPSQWMRRPLRSLWIADPLVLDSSFQMMVLWTRHYQKLLSLPCFIGSYRQYAKSFPRGPIRMEARITRVAPNRVMADLSYLSREGDVVAFINDYECVLDPGLENSFRRNQLLEANTTS